MGEIYFWRPFPIPPQQEQPSPSPPYKKNLKVYPLWTLQALSTFLPHSLPTIAAKYLHPLTWQGITGGRAAFLPALLLLLLCIDQQGANLSLIYLARSFQPPGLMF
jgi:hypothetical protein